MQIWTIFLLGSASPDIPSILCRNPLFGVVVLRVLHSVVSIPATIEWKQIEFWSPFGIGNLTFFKIQAMSLPAESAYATYNGSPESNQQQQQPITENTLDEPVMATITRDLTQIWIKIQQVLYPPQHSENILLNWDWWGPLLLCLLLSIRLSLVADENQGPIVFSSTFFIVI